MLEVVCGLIEHEGLILIGQRRPGDKHALKWEFPGGKVEPGETPAQALVRELDEELGIEGQNITEMHRYEFSYAGKPPVRLIFLHVGGFAKDVDNRIYHALAWIHPRELKNYDILEGDLAFIDWLAASSWFQTA